jgi:hypothetical protein
MSIPQKEARKLKRDLKDNARDRVFGDIRKMVEEMLPPLGEGDAAAKKDRGTWFEGLRTLVDTYSAVEKTPLTRERLNEAYSRLRKN